MLRRLMPKPRLYGFDHRLRMRLAGHATLHGPISRLSVSEKAHLCNVVINTNCGRVDIGAYVFFGHGVMLLTGTHDFRKTGRSRLPASQTADRDIVIEPGAWVASGAIIIGPCRIGSNAVIGCGCIVDFDVPPDTVVRVRQEVTMDAIEYSETGQPRSVRMPRQVPGRVHSSP